MQGTGCSPVGAVGAARRRRGRWPHAGPGSCCADGSSVTVWGPTCTASWKVWAACWQWQRGHGECRVVLARSRARVCWSAGSPSTRRPRTNAWASGWSSDIFQVLVITRRCGDHFNRVRHTTPRCPISRATATSTDGRCCSRSRVTSRTHEAREGGGGGLRRSGPGASD